MKDIRRCQDKNIYIYNIKISMEDQLGGNGSLFYNISEDMSGHQRTKPQMNIIAVVVFHH